jgi:hypothetical protein
MTRGRLVVVGGHSRGVGKTALVVDLVRSLGWSRLATVKVSAHRHGEGVPVVMEDGEPSPHTSTGRCLVAGASRALLCRCPDPAMPYAAAVVHTLVDSGWDVLVESNRIVSVVEPDVALFVVSTGIDDWKPSSAGVLARADAIVLAPGTDALPQARRGRVDRGVATPTLRFTAEWRVPGLEAFVRARTDASARPTAEGWAGFRREADPGWLPTSGATTGAP